MNDHEEPVLDSLLPRRRPLGAAVVLALTVLVVAAVVLALNSGRADQRDAALERVDGDSDFSDNLGQAVATGLGDYLASLPRISVSLADGAVTASLPDCMVEVHRLSLVALDLDSTLWEVNADVPVQSIATFRVGETPSGFRVVTALSTTDLGGLLLAEGAGTCDAAIALLESDH